MPGETLKEHKGSCFPHPEATKRSYRYRKVSKIAVTARLFTFLSHQLPFFKTTDYFGH